MTVEISTDLATAAYDAAWLNGGFTFLLGDDGVPVIPTYGYVTSVTTEQHGVLLADPFPAFYAALEYVLSTYDSAAGVGGWVHDDHIHLDPVEVYADQEDALRVAREYEQYAIHDLEHNVTITVERETEE